MKNLFASAAVVTGLLSFAGASQAAFDFAGMNDVSKLAYDDFAAANPAHVEHFTGYKVWQSGDDAKVKIYVTHGTMNMEFNYTCHVHETGPECHRQ